MENPFELIMNKLNAIEKLLMLKQEVATKEETEEIMNVEKAVKHLGMSRVTIYQYTSKRAIPHFKRGKRLFFKRSELDNWLTGNRVLSKEDIDRLTDEYLSRRKRK